jgi:hypothetical protein
MLLSSKIQEIQTKTQYLINYLELANSRIYFNHIIAVHQWISIRILAKTTFSISLVATTSRWI